MLKRRNKEPHERIGQERCPECGTENTRIAFIDLNRQQARMTCLACDNSFRVPLTDSTPRVPVPIANSNAHAS